MQSSESKRNPENTGQFEVLRSVSQSVSAANNLTEVLESVIAATLNIAGADAGLILLRSELRDELEVTASLNLTEQESLFFADLQNSMLYARLIETARKGESFQIISSQSGAESEFDAGLLPNSVDSLTGSALQVGSQAIGVLVLVSREGRPASTEDLTTLELVCSFVGFRIQAAVQAELQLAIEEELLKGSRYLECIAGITTQLLTAPYPDSLLEGIIQWLQSVTRVSRCYYATIEPGRDGSRFVSLRHESAAGGVRQIDGGQDVINIPLGSSGIEDWVEELEAGNHIYGESRISGHSRQTFPLSDDCKWLLALPIIVHSELVAVLGFEVTAADAALGDHEISLLRGAANAISSAMERTETQRELAAAHDHLENILQSSTGQAIIATDLNFTILHYNSKAQEMLGYSRREAEGINLLETALFEGSSRSDISSITDTVGSDGIWENDTELLSPAGESLVVNVVVSGMVGQDGMLYGYTVFCRDVTDLRINERQLVERQRMESVGLLAGGIAHDFNNILMGILGYASLAKDRLETEHPVHRMVSVIEKSAERAATLTKELLAYARGGKSQTTSVKIAEQVEEILAIVGTNLPKGIEIQKCFEPGVPFIKADPAQLQQVIMNLCINAGDAIAQKAAELDSPEFTGKICIRSFFREVSNRERRQLGLQDNPPGLKYVCLEVEDTGIGMDEKTKSRIFEPFYTTKITGRGLGLSAVEGIIRNHKGCLNVESTPGVGSRFTILLPEDPSVRDAQAVEEEITVPGGNETILVIDDEEVNRQLVLLTLTNVGYEVLLAENGREGLEVYKENQQRISLVLLDLTMPGLSVESVLRRFAEFEPEVPVILTSGFDKSRIRDIKGTDLARGFLQKPYAPDSLARAVRKVLDGNQEQV